MAPVTDIIYDIIRLFGLFKESSAAHVCQVNVV